MPKKAPVSIIPSRPMFTTPLRSEKRPPIAAKMSGVAKRSVAAVSADQAKTVSRLPSPEKVAIAPAGIARNAPIATHHPSRFSPRASAQTPQKRPRKPIAIGA